MMIMIMMANFAHRLLLPAELAVPLAVLPLLEEII